MKLFTIASQYDEKFLTEIILSKNLDKLKAIRGGRGAVV